MQKNPQEPNWNHFRRICDAKRGISGVQHDPSDKNLEVGMESTGDFLQVDPLFKKKKNSVDLQISVEKQNSCPLRSVCLFSHENKEFVLVCIKKNN